MRLKPCASRKYETLMVELQEKHDKETEKLKASYSRALVEKSAVQAELDGRKNFYSCCVSTYFSGWQTGFRTARSFRKIEGHRWECQAKWTNTKVVNNKWKLIRKYIFKKYGGRARTKITRGTRAFWAAEGLEPKIRQPVNSDPIWKQCRLTRF